VHIKTNISRAITKKKGKKKAVDFPWKLLGPIIQSPETRHQGSRATKEPKLEAPSTYKVLVIYYTIEG